MFMLFFSFETQGREIHVPAPGPPKHFLWNKITGTNDFAYLSRSIIWTRGARKKEKCPPAGTGTKISFPSNITSFPPKTLEVWTPKSTNRDGPGNSGKFTPFDNKKRPKLICGAGMTHEENKRAMKGRENQRNSGIPFGTLQHSQFLLNNLSKELSEKFSQHLYNNPLFESLRESLKTLKISKPKQHLRGISATCSKSSTVEVHMKKHKGP